jgi:hypothetical protein
MPPSERPRTGAPGSESVERPSPRRFEEHIITDSTLLLWRLAGVSKGRFYQARSPALRGYALIRTSCLPLETDSP